MPSFVRTALESLGLGLSEVLRLLTLTWLTHWCIVVSKGKFELLR